ncbi:hypothetical protein V9T40_013834 [Parthenolecanium corni]|uniref:Uncharacterized protein n=1 Tax=Parthenolecanium corni TaxID=536013 RepID=A0AAN9TSU8_9HEMI
MGKKRLLERRARLVKFILQYAPKFEYLRGESNVVADTLSRIEPIEAVPPVITLTKIAAAQNTDAEIARCLLK